VLGQAVNFFRIPSGYVCKLICGVGKRRGILCKNGSGREETSILSAESRLDTVASIAKNCPEIVCLLLKIF
jgi:hypothetical protein